MALLDHLAAKAAFHNEARYQRCCQHPACEDKYGRWAAHHVIYRQELVRHAPELAYDPRDAMRLCVKCHLDRQHGRQCPVPVAAIRDETIEFAIEIMGFDRAVSYFDRYYDNRGGDDRLKVAYWREREKAA